MGLGSFAMDALITMGLLFGYHKTITGMWFPQAAPKKPVHSSSSVTDVIRMNFEDDPEMKAEVEALSSRPLVVNGNFESVGDVPVRRWAYDIDREKNEIVKIINPTDEEIRKLPSVGKLCSCYYNKLNDPRRRNWVNAQGGLDFKVDLIKLVREARESINQNQ